MSYQVLDKTVFIAPDNTTVVPTSSDIHSLTISGDTIQWGATRNVTLNSTGNPYEVVIRPFTILNITTWYICVCIAPNTWRGTALSNLPI